MTKQTTLRPNQEQIVTYRSGKMGISAVPGSGKTWTLSLLAARIILSGVLRPDQEVLIVTFANYDTQYDRIVFFINNGDIVTHYGSSFKSDAATYGMPF